MIKVRKANPEDEDNIFALIKELFRLLSPEVTRDWGRSITHFRKLMTDEGKGTVFVAEDDGEMVGLISLSYPEAIRCGGVYSSVEEFIVDEKARGKGVGGQLMEAALAESAGRGCNEIIVNNPSELGYPLYLRYGLKDNGINLMLKLRRQGN
jgi:predicted N-acetyltransferase YhbS